MPEGYGYSPEGIRQYLEDLAKKHGILPPDVPPADNRDIVNKGLTRPPTGANLGDPLEFTMNPETGERIPTGRTGRVQGPHISEVGPSQRIPSTQRRTLGQQPRQQPPQPPGLQRPPVGDTGARGLGRGLPAVSGVASSPSIISALDALRRNPPGQGQVLPGLKRRRREDR